MDNLSEKNEYPERDTEIKILISKAREGDKNAQAMLVENNIGLVWSVVRRFRNRGIENDDLFQIGCIGLIKSIAKFDNSFNVRFSTYAVPMIIGEIKRYLRDDGLVKVSRSLKETANKVKVVREVMTKELGREPSVGEMAERLDIPVEELVMALEAGYLPESLFNTVGESDSNSILLIDRINDEANGNETDLVDRIALKQVLDELPPRERQIIVLRYFKEKTQVQIASALGISQVQVSRIEKRILQDIRKKINSF
jgi:RNA polymerase sporulation-specific sigma factor